MICYHGSDTFVDIPRILEPKRPLDFGGGFYVTTSKKRKLLTVTTLVIDVLIVMSLIWKKQSQNLQ